MKKTLFITTAILAQVAGPGLPGVSFAQENKVAVEAKTGEGVRFPSSIAGQRIKGFFDAYASKNPEVYAKWLKENRTEEAYNAAPLEARLDFFRQDIQVWGDLTVGEIRKVSPTVVEVQAKDSQRGNWRKFTFTLAENPPYRIGQITIEPSLGPGNEVFFDQRWSDLKEFAAQYLEKSGVPAVALGVLRDGQIIDQAVSGERLAGSGNPVAPRDTFHWGSLGKSVTGTLIGRLIEEGILDWDTTIGEVLGDMQMREEYRDATISQLMSHQAGIPRYGNFTPQQAARFGAYEGSTGTEKRAQFVADLLLEEPLGKPGQIGAYSNAGVALAGYMAEKLTGRSWQDLVQKYIFEPAGMTTAGFGWPQAFDPQNQPHGHFGGSRIGYNPQPDDAFSEISSIMAPAGDVRSSVADMLKYAKIHLDGMNGRDGVLKAKTVQRLHTPIPGAVAVDGETYTFGWGLGCPGIEETVCHWHNGSAGSFFAELQLYPEKDMAIAYMTNAAQPANLLSEKVFKTLYEHFSR